VCLCIHKYRKYKIFQLKYKVWFPKDPKRITKTQLKIIFDTKDQHAHPPWNWTINPTKLKSLSFQLKHSQRILWTRLRCILVRLSDSQACKFYFTYIVLVLLKGRWLLRGQRRVAFIMGILVYWTAVETNFTDSQTKVLIKMASKLMLLQLN
jgi:hypothetical protein